MTAGLQAPPRDRNPKKSAEPRPQDGKGLRHSPKRRAIEARVRNLTLRPSQAESPDASAPLSAATFKALGDEKRLEIVAALGSALQRLA